MKTPKERATELVYSYAYLKSGRGGWIAASLIADITAALKEQQEYISALEVECEAAGRCRDNAEQSFRLNELNDLDADPPSHEDQVKDIKAYDQARAARLALKEKQ
jgi:hypothetical protein